MKSVGAMIAVLAAAVMLATTVLAQDVVKERQEVMKTRSKAGSKLAVQMIRGIKPYDGASLSAAMTKISEVPDLFLPLVKAGTSAADNKDSELKAEAFKAMDDFKARMADLKKTSLAAAAAAKQGADQFKVAFKKMAEVCKGCHEKYRAEK
jgi:cytochrome c556